jgi:hypothetical protein
MSLVEDATRRENGRFPLWLIFLSRNLSRRQRARRCRRAVGVDRQRGFLHELDARYRPLLPDREVDRELGGVGIGDRHARLEAQLDRRVGELLDTDQRVAFVKFGRNEFSG